MFLNTMLQSTQYKRIASNGAAPISYSSQAINTVKARNNPSGKYEHSSLRYKEIQIVIIDYVGLIVYNCLIKFDICCVFNKS